MAGYAVPLGVTVWVPPLDRQRLCWPRNTVIIGQTYTETGFKRGVQWHFLAKMHKGYVTFPRGNMYHRKLHVILYGC